MNNAPNAAPETLVRRTWFYRQSPSKFDVAPCACGNAEIEWSEFEGRCWCSKCEIDFIPAHAGIFDGPIPVRAFYALGGSFDRIKLSTLDLDRYNLEAGKYESELPL